MQICRVTNRGNEGDRPGGGPSPRLTAACVTARGESILQPGLVSASRTLYSWRVRTDQLKGLGTLQDGGGGVGRMRGSMVRGSTESLGWPGSLRPGTGTGSVGSRTVWVWVGLGWLSSFWKHEGRCMSLSFSVSCRFDSFFSLTGRRLSRV